MERVVRLGSAWWFRACVDALEGPYRRNIHAPTRRQHRVEDLWKTGIDMFGPVFPFSLVPTIRLLPCDFAVATTYCSSSSATRAFDSSITLTVEATWHGNTAPLPARPESSNWLTKSKTVPSPIPMKDGAAICRAGRLLQRTRALVHFFSRSSFRL